MPRKKPQNLLAKFFQGPLYNLKRALSKYPFINIEDNSKSPDIISVNNEVIKHDNQIEKYENNLNNQLDRKQRIVKNRILKHIHENVNEEVYIPSVFLNDEILVSSQIEHMKFIRNPIKRLKLLQKDDEKSQIMTVDEDLRKDHDDAQTMYPPKDMNREFSKRDPSSSSTLEDIDTNNFKDKHLLLGKPKKRESLLVRKKMKDAAKRSSSVNLRSISNYTLWKWHQLVFTYFFRVFPVLIWHFLKSLIRMNPYYKVNSDYVESGDTTVETRYQNL